MCLNLDIFRLSRIKSCLKSWVFGKMYIVCVCILYVCLYGTCIIFSCFENILYSSISKCIISTSSLHKHFSSLGYFPLSIYSVICFLYIFLSGCIENLILDTVRAL